MTSFICATELQTGAVYEQLEGLAVMTRLWAWHLQRLRPAAQGRVVRRGQGEPEQADDGTDQAFCLAQGQAEKGPERGRRQNRQGRIPALPVWGRMRRRPPALDGFVHGAQRRVAALAQAGVTRGRVRELAPLLWDLVTAVLVQLKGQGGHSGSEKGRISYVAPTHGVTGRIRAAAPLMMFAFSGKALGVSSKVIEVRR